MDSPTLKADTDEYLMQQVQQRDESAFSLLVQRHTQSIHAFIYRLCGNQSDAEDIAQETFLRLWQRAAQWTPNTVQLSTWLHQIARNLCIDQFRRERSTKRSSVQETVDLVDSTIDSIEDAAQRRAIRDAIRTLPERQRTAIVLCQVQGWTQQDAAKVLDTTVDGVQALIGRARRTLRGLLMKNNE
ncbi:MAG: sigma-70 family RNA polymerase sigma factor [Gammaproteobacteria bacterium]|nr:sigma-70 family RNA polymerase sigma factor [Gammaproteobacteria bacterium]